MYPSKDLKNHNMFTKIESFKHNSYNQILKCKKKIQFNKMWKIATLGNIHFYMVYYQKVIYLYFKNVYKNNLFYLLISDY